MKRIELIASEGLAPGMTVAESVLDDAGRVLVSTGTVLTEGTIASLIRRDVQAVMVELIVEEDAEVFAARSLRIKHRLDQIFRLAGDSEETQALYQVVFDYRLEHGE